MEKMISLEIRQHQFFQSELSNLCKTISLISKKLSKTTHKNIKCNKCYKTPIIGVRHKCSSCINYNLYLTYEELNVVEQFHPKNHIFIKIHYDNHLYSYQCLNKKEDIFLYKNVYDYSNFLLRMKNNGIELWKKYFTKLICHKAHSEFICDDVEMKGANKGEEVNAVIDFMELILKE